MLLLKRGGLALNVGIDVLAGVVVEEVIRKHQVRLNGIYIKG